MIAQVNKAVLHPNLLLLAPIRTVRIDNDLVDIQTGMVDRFPSKNAAKRRVRLMLDKGGLKLTEYRVRTFRTPQERMRYLKVLHAALDNRKKT